MRTLDLDLRLGCTRQFFYPTMVAVYDQRFKYKGEFMLQKVLALALTMFVAQTAHAIPGRPGPRPMLGKPSLDTSYDFEGIVDLNNCSGSVIRLENSKPTDTALVLTNGHCIGFNMMRPGEVVYRKPVRKSFDILDSRGVEIGRVSATQLIYATMTDTDMALYRLQETYADIESRFKVRPFTLQSARPEVGQAMQVVSGYWKKGYSCKIEAFVHSLQEEDWTMRDSIRYSRPGCEVIGGTSGSPIIATGTRTVIGVNNTGNEDGARCTRNNPCEIDEKGNVFYQKGYSYGQQTFNVYSCLTASGDFDLQVPGCRLPK